MRIWLRLFSAACSQLCSSANLNRSYFTNRQDRYWHFTSQHTLANYCFAFLRTIAGFSYQMTCSGSASTKPIISWPDPSTKPWRIQPLVEHSLATFQASHLTASTVPATSTNTNDVLLFPVIQGGQFNIREEERAVSMLFEHLENRTAFDMPKPRMNLTSGYFGLSKSYQDLILKSSIGCEILVASPKVCPYLEAIHRTNLDAMQANGFYGSRGLSGLIPEGYTLLERRFMRAVHVAGRDADSQNGSADAVRLSEWMREGWTYHAKGRTSPAPRSYN